VNHGDRIPVLWPAQISDSLLLTSDRCRDEGIGAKVQNHGMAKP